MHHLRPFTRGFIHQPLGANRFLIDPQYRLEIQSVLERFFAQPHARTTLDKPEENRGVYLLQGDQHQWVLKFNRLTSWKKQLANFWGWKKSYGLHDLTNEMINLRRISASELTPEVGAYGYRALHGYRLQDEYLLVRFFADHTDVDIRLKQAPEQAEQLLEQIFTLFSHMLDQGFCHMDPHPKNILIAPDGPLRLIDFECCAHQVFNRDFTLGFLHGYFYRYWFQRFLAKERYDAVSRDYLQTAHPQLDQRTFSTIYLRFRDHKVSRRTRYAILTSQRAQEAFLRESATSTTP
ncbi:phosphotransferase [Pseudomonas sp. GOM6]|uniref:phosphotransferase n=1 Tax=Pseudomonas sp. GOM6 TaxID=3036944 RepID=UPI00240A57F4|nr:phosphotransferase [Pseudomonas sp. GOM6]MDG1580053.1 lipopolysaccharide kinase InaA family protein [Pseudomonas sp. GOM6]